jgi:hypothetical protein
LHRIQGKRDSFMGFSLPRKCYINELNMIGGYGVINGNEKRKQEKKNITTFNSHELLE